MMSLSKKRQIMEWKHADSLPKKKFWTHQSLKKVMRTVICDMKGPITIDFIQKGSIVYSFTYFQLLRQNLPYLLKDPPIYMVSYWHNTRKLGKLTIIHRFE